MTTLFDFAAAEVTLRMLRSAQTRASALSRATAGQVSADSGEAAVEILRERYPGATAFLLRPAPEPRTDQVEIASDRRTPWGVVIPKVRRTPIIRVQLREDGSVERVD